jgi:5-methyltetrahydrofolate--homocysteine methyltransferase
MSLNRNERRIELATILETIFEAVVNGDDVTIKELIESALAENIDPQTIFDKSLIPAMNEVGRRMEAEEYFLPEVLVCGRTMNIASGILKPFLVQGAREPSGKVVIGTVEGDLHDLGKNLVIMMLEGVGFDVTDLGIDVPTYIFIEQVKKLKPDILAMSALLTTTMLKMEEVIRELVIANCRDGLIIMVGGATIDQKFASKIGADGYASDAGGAARVAKQLVLERKNS